VTTSTNHAEYVAFAKGAKEAQWLIYLFDDLEPMKKHTPLPLYVDNAGIISIVQNPVDHAANKHIRIAYHFARELAESQIIAPQRIPSEENLADLLTKALAGPLFLKLSKRYAA